MSVWDDIVGQEKAVATLQEAARAARHIVEGNSDRSTHSMTHAWLVTGPPGSGRSNAALAFAACLQCTGSEIGCGTCPGCVTTVARTNADVLSVATETSIITAEQVRDIIMRAQVAPSQGRWRVIVIEDADRIQELSLNILLKAIEEPPERTVWVLCAPSPEDMITTVRSRCRQLSLRIPSVDAVAGLLVRQLGVDMNVAREAARAAQCHIGRAKALARDPEERDKRRQRIRAAIHVASVGEAAVAAHDLVEMAKSDTETVAEQRNTEEEAKLRYQLGMVEGDKMTPHVRSQLRQLRENQTRRMKRSLTDMLDRILLDVMSVYRDVLMLQLGANQDLMNDDVAEVIERIARTSSPEQTLARIDLIDQARTRLTNGANPLLAMEAMVVALR